MLTLKILISVSSLSGRLVTEPLRRCAGAQQMQMQSQWMLRHQHTILINNTLGKYW